MSPARLRHCNHEPARWAHHPGYNFTKPKSQVWSTSLNLATKSTKNDTRIFICFRKTTQTQTLLDCWKISAKASSSLSIFHGLCIGKQKQKPMPSPKKSLEKQKMLSTKQRRLLHLVLMDISAGIFGHKNVDLDERETNLILFQAGKDGYGLSPPKQYRRQWLKTKKSIPNPFPQKDRFNNLRQTFPPQKLWGVPGSSSVSFVWESRSHWFEIIEAGSGWSGYISETETTCVYTTICIHYSCRVYFMNTIYTEKKHILILYILLIFVYRLGIPPQPKPT